jgi:two-component system OmpR family sensor kinase
VKLRTRLQLSVTIVTAAALLASFVPLYLLVDAAETRDLDHALFRHAYVAARRLPSTFDTSRPLDAGLVRVPESLEPTTRYLAVYDAAGAVLATSASFADDAPSLADMGLSEVALEGEAIDLNVVDVSLRGVIMPLPGRDEYFLYAASQRTIVDDMQLLNRLLLLFFVLGTLVTSLVARWVGERLARDVHAIAGVARSVAEGDLKARVCDAAAGSDETRALAADLDNMISQLSSLVESQRTFISHAAHELRSPLATLLGELQLALRRPRSADEYRRSLDAMYADVEALVRLAEDLLLLARVQAGAARPQEPTTVDVIVAEGLRMARGRAEERRVEIRVTGLDAAAGARVQAVRGELARVLRNLVDNAIAHSPVDSEVRVAISRVDDRIEIAVSDSGAGVHPDDRPHIFAPFYRGLKDAPEGLVGAGLGLSIARTIVRGAGGELVLDESHHPGARFVVRLPVA